MHKSSATIYDAQYSPKSPEVLDRDDNPCPTAEMKPVDALPRGIFYFQPRGRYICPVRRAKRCLWWSSKGDAARLRFGSLGEHIDQNVSVLPLTCRAARHAHSSVMCRVVSESKTGTSSSRQVVTLLADVIGQRAERRMNSRCTEPITLQRCSGWPGHPTKVGSIRERDRQLVRLKRSPELGPPPTADRVFDCIQMDLLWAE